MNNFPSRVHTLNIFSSVLFFKARSNITLRYRVRFSEMKIFLSNSTPSWEVFKASEPEYSGKIVDKVWFLRGSLPKNQPHNSDEIFDFLKNFCTKQG